MGLPPRVVVDRVLIVVKTEGNDLKFRIIVPVWTAHACSPVMTIKADASSWNGNPFCVYGAAIEDYVGCSKHDVSISVSRIHSGEI